MKSNIKVFYRTVFWASALLLSIPDTFAARYYFSQNLTENGRISGYFDGEDNSGGEPAPPDSKITVQFPGYDYEVTKFVMHYSGNALLNSFNCGNNNCGHALQSFEYDIAKNSLSFLDYGYLNREDGAWYIDYSGHTGAPSIDNWALSARFFASDGDGLPLNEQYFQPTSPLIVTQSVPLPGALLLFFSGLAGLFLLKRPA